MLWDNDYWHSLQLNELESFPFLLFQLSQLLGIPRTLPYPWSKLVEQKWEDAHDGSENGEDGGSPSISHCFMRGGNTMRWMYGYTQRIITIVVKLHSNEGENATKGLWKSNKRSIHGRSIFSTCLVQSSVQWLRCWPSTRSSRPYNLTRQQRLPVFWVNSYLVTLTMTWKHTNMTGNSEPNKPAKGYIHVNWRTTSPCEPEHRYWEERCSWNNMVSVNTSVCQRKGIYTRTPKEVYAPERFFYPPPSPSIMLLSVGNEKAERPG